MLDNYNSLEHRLKRSLTYADAFEVAESIEYLYSRINQLPPYEKRMYKEMYKNILYQKPVTMERQLECMSCAYEKFK